MNYFSIHITFQITYVRLWNRWQGTYSIVSCYHQLSSMRSNTSTIPYICTCICHIEYVVLVSIPVSADV